MFEQLHASKIFLRSDPAPIDIKHTAHHRLINNKNNFKTFLSKDGEQYKVRVFENFKEMSRQMNKAYLRNAENQKYFKQSAGLVPEDQRRIKEQDDRTLD